MTTLLTEAFLFFLPAGVANMSPIFASRLPLLKRWNAPLDCGLKHRGERLLGDNKTWRGLVTGTLMGGLTNVFIQSFVLARGDSLAYLFLTGCLLGCGALAGDAVESYVKRRRGIAPGESWFPFDQIDYIAGGLLFVYPMVLVPVSLVLAIGALYFGLHLLFSYLGYLAKLKPTPI